MLKGSNSKLYITYSEYMYVCLCLLKLDVKEVLCSLFLSGGSVINNYIFPFLMEIHRNFRVSLTKTWWIDLDFGEFPLATAWNVVWREVKIMDRCPEG